MAFLNRTACCLALILVGGCGSNSGGAPHHGDAEADGLLIVPPTEAGLPESGGQEAAPESSGPFAAAPHDPAPQVVSAGGHVLAQPRVVPVFFPNDPYKPAIEQFLTELAKSSYWGATTSEYGVGTLTIAPSVVTTSTPPTTYNAVDQWVTGLVAHAGTGAAGSGGAAGASGDGGLQDGGGGASGDGAASGDAGVLDAAGGASGDAGTPVPPPTPDTLYAIFLPPGVTVTDPQLGTSCVQYGGYHSETYGVGLGSGVAYALIPRCAQFNYTSGIDAITTVTSHELIEAATDPYPFSDPAYHIVDDPHAIWNAQPMGEIGDMCVDEPQSYANLFGNFIVQRVWSNAAAAAGHDPCVPSAMSSYYNAVPDQPDDLSLLQGGINTQTRGVKLAVGQTRTINVHLFSDAPRADWFVQAQDADSAFGGSPSLSVSLDRHYGNNGNVLKLTITRTAASPGGGSEFVLWSRDQQTHSATTWFGYVGN